MKKYDVAGLGQSSLDHLFQVPAYPPLDVKCEFSGLTIEGGGPVASAMVTLSRLGLSAACLGKVGDDQAGEAIIERLKDEGVATSGIIKAAGKTSQIAFIAVEEGSGHRNIFWTRGTAHPLLQKEIKWNILRNSRFLHLDGLHIEASIAAAQFARNLGIPIMLDAGTLRDEIKPLLPLIDYLVVAEGFARALAGGDNMVKALHSLAEFGARMVCITMGHLGSLGLEGGRVYVQKAYPIDAMDTTGCGDAFHGGLIYAILQNWSTQRALEFASAVAALKCRKMGGRAGLPTLDEVNRFFLAHNR
jgi:sulfofructose kinase